MEYAVITLRQIRIDDAEMLFKWRNDSEIVSLGTSKKTVGWDEHKQWLSNSIKDDTQRKIFIIEIDEHPAGQIRFDKHKDFEAIISVYLLKEYRKKGLGSKAISIGSEMIFKQWNKISRILAFIKSNNLGSIKSFENAGYFHSEIKETPPEHISKVLINKNIIIPHNRLTFGSVEAEAVSTVVKSGYWALGNQVQLFEEKCAEITNRKHAVAVSSGISAIRLSLLALGIKTGHEVIIPGYACVALANAVLSVGAKPVLADIEEKTLNISTDSVRKIISAKTAAIIAVHTFGLPSPIRELRQVAGLPILEDCAHCLGIHPETGQIGSLGDVSISSFYATKLVGGGEGGMVLMDKSEIAEFVLEMRDYTDKSPNAHRMNDKMHNIEAALSLEQLNRLPDFIRVRKEVATKYHQAFSPFTHQGFELPYWTEDRVWYRYAIRLTNKAPEQVMEKMEKDGILTDKPVWDWTGNTDSIPASKIAYNQILSLPCYPTLRSDEQDRVIESFLKHISEG